MPQNKANLLRSGAETSKNEGVLRVAQRLIWWAAPEEALADRIRFAAQVMTFGSWDDVQVVRNQFGEEIFREVLASPPTGVFDLRSWLYWHRYFRIDPIPPLPKRNLA